MTLPFTLSPAVEAALSEGRPVVALESTIITHGMPWPQNLDMARGVETLIRDAGAEPASFVEPPGFLLHEWDAARGLTTHLVPIGSWRGPLPFA